VTGRSPIGDPVERKVEQDIQGRHHDWPFSAVPPLVASFDWKAPSVTVEVGCTKNGEEATLTIPEEPIGRHARWSADQEAVKPAGSSIAWPALAQ
jgi:hypothetical protein